MVRVFFTFLIFSVFVLNGQETPLNTKLISHVPFNENSSGMWGYVDQNGLKYAVIGTASATRVFSLEDPANPIERFVAPGAVGIWREVRYYKNYIYVSTDQGADGLVIIDMTNAPENISYSFYKPEIPVGEETRILGRCHNIFIDEKGFCYLSGCSVQNGILVFDLNANPTNPPLVGSSNLNYSHDVYVRNDTLYNSEITANPGKLAIYDVTDKSDIKLINTQVTGRAFTHNAWTSDDGKYVFTTDERANAYVESYDISNVNEPKFLDRYRTLKYEGTGVIPHNTYYKNGYLITSYYTDGIRIIDAAKPDNLVEVAYYDTYNDPLACHSGFSGCWGVYPLDDGPYVYGSDINFGLFIIEVDYKRACYLEGVVKDSDGQAISNAKIEILSEQINREFTTPSGEYKTGLAIDGSFQVQITHPDFVTQIVTVNLERGSVTVLDPVLFKKRPIDVSFVIKDKDAEGIPANIFLKNNSKPYNLTASSEGELNQTLLSASYELFLSAWGYENIYEPEFTVGIDADNELVTTLEKGYHDNFENNLNWTVESTPDMAGEWERVIPRLTNFGEIIANPSTDSDDFGVIAYVTGNGISGAACDDVDNGVTRLISPPMDLSDFNLPKLNYDVWFFNAGGSSAINDTLVIKLTNGLEEVVVDKVFGTTDGWKSIRELDLLSFISTEDSLRLIVEASDISGSGHLVEAGFDNFFVTQTVVSSSEDLTSLNNKVTIYPNPSNDYLIIELSEKRNIEVLDYQIVSAMGSVSKVGKIDFHTTRLDINELPVGMYFLDIKGKAPVKFIKQ
ncbi:MAG TPA: choice-of-anchor B family protein [Saprospiraceae bacterium]|nr:choice-of-anchor B family protein [Saprospiraceae bacterium]